MTIDRPAGAGIGPDRQPDGNLSGPRGPLFYVLARAPAFQLSPTFNPGLRNVSSGAGLALHLQPSPSHKKKLAAGTQCLLGWGHALVYGKPGTPRSSAYPVSATLTLEGLTTHQESSLEPVPVTVPVKCRQSERQAVIER